jgi:hypothetical protein
MAILSGLSSFLKQYMGGEPRPLTFAIVDPTAAGAPAPGLAGAGTTEDLVVDPKVLKPIAGKLSLGYLAVSAVLTFLGVKDSNIGKIVAVNPHLTLLVLALVGAGLVSAVVASAARSDRGVAAELVVVAASVIIGLTLIITPDLSSDTFEVWGRDALRQRFEHHSVAVAVGLVLFVLVLGFSRERAMHVATAAVIASVTLLGMGIYAASAAVVLYHRTSLSSVITAQASVTDGVASLAVHVVDDSLRTRQQLLVAVYAGPSRLAVMPLTRREGEQLDRTITVSVPVALGRQDAIVAACYAATRSDGVSVAASEDPCGSALYGDNVKAVGPYITARITLPFPGQQFAALTGTVTASKSTLTATVETAASGVVQARLLCGLRTVASAGLTVRGAARAQQLAASAITCPSRRHQAIVLQARRCGVTPCSAPWEELARLQQ